MEFRNYLSDNNLSIIGTIPKEYSDGFIKNTNSNSQDKIIDLVFVIDTSGSMDCGLGYSKFSLDKPSDFVSKAELVIQSLMKCIDYIKILSSNNHKIRLSIISFKETSEIIIDKLLVSDADFNNKIIDLSIKLKPNGGTNIFTAMKDTDTHVQTILQTNTQENINIIVMTDGYNNKTDENKYIVEFFKSVSYKDRVIGMGIGNVKDYDAELLNSLFDNLKCSPSSQELIDNIIGEAFGACSTIFTDFQIVFNNVDESNFYSPLKVKFENNNAILDIKTIDFSQKLIFNINIKESPFSMKVSYNNVITQEPYEHIFNNLEECISDSNIHDRIEIICKQMERFKNIFKNKIQHKDNIDITKNILDNLAKITERADEIGELCNANEVIVKNHYTELLKYKDHESYYNYTNLATKSINSTINVGKSPMISRTTSTQVSDVYRQKSCPIPNELSELQNLCVTNKEEDYVQNTTVNI